MTNSFEFTLVDKFAKTSGSLALGPNIIPKTFGVAENSNNHLEEQILWNVYFLTSKVIGWREPPSIALTVWGRGHPDKWRSYRDAREAHQDGGRP